MLEPSRLCAALILGGFLLGANAAPAVLVVFEDGHHLRVSDFEVVEERVTLRFRGGGEMTIPIERVDRIVDDELEPIPAPLPEPPKEKGSLLSVRASAPTGAGDVPFAGLISAAAAEHRIDPALVAAVIRAESNFVARAVSRKGARGLMQLMPATAKRLGVSRSFDPGQNIRGGTAYLSELASRFGETSVEKVLAAYNAGERAVDQYGGVPPYRETRDYVRRVMKSWLASRGS